MADSRTTTRYILDDPREVEVDGEYIDRQVVLKQVTFTDGTNRFVKQEKKVANSLAEFRETYPNITVVGVPTYDELSRVSRDLSDEDLAKLGLQRTATHLEQYRDAFASEEAFVLANEAGLSMQVIKFQLKKGSGRNDTYTAPDVRDVIASVEAEETGE